ncbi:MAG: glycosyltransferase family 39 protein [Endomicrobiales bacterium]
MKFPAISKITFILAALLLAGASLRLANITKKGFFVYDEAAYMLEAQNLSMAADWLRENRAAPGGAPGLSDLKNHLREKGCLFPLGMTAKPFYFFGLSLWTLVFGNFDFASFVFSALWGLGILLAAFFLSRRLWNEETAFASLFLLFFSVENLFYSRSGQPVTMAAFFLLLAVYLAVKEKELWAGAALALAFATHYCLLFNVFLFSLWMAVFRRNKLLPFLAGFLAPLLLFEGAYRVEKAVLAPWITDISFYTYFEHLHRQFTWGSKAANPLSGHDWLLVLRVLFRPEGIFMAAMGLAFLFFPLYKRKEMRSAEWLVWLNGWGVLGIWIVSPGLIVPRSLFPAWTMVLLGAGWALAHFKSRFIRIAFITAVAAFALPRFFGLITVSSGYQNASRWIKDVQGQKQIVELFDWPLYQYYMKERIPANIDRVRGIEDLKSWHEKGIIYLVVDFYSTFWDVKYWGFVKDIVDSQPPVAIFPAGLFDHAWLRYHVVFTDEDQRRMALAPPGNRDIRVYDLREYFARQRTAP